MALRRWRTSRRTTKAVAPTTRLQELAVLIEAAGVSLKEMDATARSAHAVKCSADRSITAKGVAAIAEKMGCSADENTKAKRLERVFNEYI